MASLATRSGSDSHRESGLTVAANGDGTATVEAGLGMLRYEGGVHTSDRIDDNFQTWDNPVVFGVDVPQATVEIVDGNSNDIWLWVDLDGGDVEVYLRHGSGVNAPSEPAMQLASITADGTVTPVAPDQPPLSASTIEAQSGEFDESHVGVEPDERVDREEPLVERDLRVREDRAGLVVESAVTILTEIPLKGSVAAVLDHRQRTAARALEAIAPADLLQQVRGAFLRTQCGEWKHPTG